MFNFEITICIITYNRGKRALENVNNILTQINNEWCVLVLNNGSNLEVNFYDEIKNLSEINSQLFYVRHPINIQIHGNFRSCFDYAKSRYIMILSDEDFINSDGLFSTLSILKFYEKVGVCRPSIAPHPELITPGNSYVFQDNYFIGGKAALNGFAFVGNYISGVIYNVELIKNMGLLEVYDRKIIAHRNYPHLYLDLLVSSKLDVLITSNVTVLERKGEETLIENGTSSVASKHIGLYGYGERINQFLALRDAVREVVDLADLNTDSEKIKLFIELNLLLISKYFYLIFKVNITNYTSNSMERNLLLDSFFYLVCSSILTHPYIGNHDELVANQIVKIYEGYKREFAC